MINCYTFWSKHNNKKKSNQINLGFYLVVKYVSMKIIFFDKVKLSWMVSSQKRLETQKYAAPW